MAQRQRRQPRSPGQASRTRKAPDLVSATAGETPDELDETTDELDETTDELSAESTTTSLSPEEPSDETPAGTPSEELIVAQVSAEEPSESSPVEPSASEASSGEVLDATPAEPIASEASSEEVLDVIPAEPIACQTAEEHPEEAPAELDATQASPEELPDETPAVPGPAQRLPAEEAVQPSKLPGVSNVFREFSSKTGDRPIRPKEVTMGSLTSDMTRLHEDIKSLYAGRRNLIETLIRTSDERKNNVAQMTATFRADRMEMGKKGRQDRGAFLGGLKNSVDTLRNDLRSDLAEAGRIFRSGKG